MNTVETSTSTWIELTHKLGKAFEERARKNDETGEFVFANYEDLKKHKFFSAAIPKEFGGGGASHAEMCNIIRTIAHYCSSTALAFSMHQHLIAAANWKLKNKNLGQSMLQNVAENELVLISTGARDWLGSNGELKKTEGGYLFSGKKHFASQSIAGDVVITSAQFLNPNNEWEVLHFSAPMSADGISLADDWNVMGMRATGSQTIGFNEVFIPDSAISLSRPKDEFHPIWGVVLTVALPLIMSAYVGIAEKAMEIAIEKGKKYARNSDHLPYMIGKLNNHLISAQSQLMMMSALTNDFDFKPNESTTIQVLSYKTNISEDTKQVVADAMEIIGGQSFYRANNLERLFRDVQASPFHPLPKWDQYAFTGERLLRDKSM
jgi:alkylation response protein AidB-like acyl-CoA dehydrogenase